MKGWEFVSFYLVGPNKQREIKQEQKRKKEMGLSVFVFSKRVLYSILVANLRVARDKFFFFFMIMLLF